jgi:hypothetical protein
MLHKNIADTLMSVIMLSDIILFIIMPIAIMLSFAIMKLSC